MPSHEKDEHVNYQKNFFDQHVDLFKQEIPPDVEARSAEIVRLILRNPESERLLDVGTGTGAFIRHYHCHGLPYENIVACDLSAAMLAEAKQRFPRVNFWQGDILNFPTENESFDIAVFNACFGNIFEPFDVLKHVVGLLKPAGRIAISHPCHSCVPQLRVLDPELVLRLLPSREELMEWCAALHLRLSVYRNETDLYLAILDKENIGEG
jgi:ubiquinone/menaquinone biosynthesis C-methylase UbiE